MNNCGNRLVGVSTESTVVVSHRHYKPWTQPPFESDII